MNSATPGPDDEDHCYDTALNLSAATLDVYKHEHLANTEIPMKNQKSKPSRSRTLAFLKAMFYWLLSR
jgi:hypothetical protein